MFAFFFAKRYFFSKKIRNIINLISGISVLAVTIGSAALIIILSVFNGIDELVKSLLNTFDPDLKIELAVGKNFEMSENFSQKLTNIEEIAHFSYIIEENALLQYSSRKFVGTILGVQDNFTQITGIDSMMVSGVFKLKNPFEDHIVENGAVLGSGIANKLSVSLSSLKLLNIWVPLANQKFSLDPSGLFSKAPVYPVGVFSIQQEYDIKYVIVSLDYAHELLKKPNKASAVIIKLKNNTDAKYAAKKIALFVGPEYKVLDRYQQHSTLYKMMKSEKKMIFIIFIFVLLIASFNGIGSITMLILDKKHDIFILSALGVTEKNIRNIFALNSSLIFFAGAFFGVSFGALISYIQQKFGIIGLPETGTFIIDSYPVKILTEDIINIFLSVSMIGIFFSWLSSTILIKNLSKTLVQNKIN